MSATAPNYVYIFGKKRPDAEPPAVMTKERIEEAKKNVSRYLKREETRLGYGDEEYFEDR